LQLKSDLGIRPVYHQLENLGDAHLFVAFLAYSAMVTLKKRLQIHAPGLTPKAVLEKMATIQMPDVWLPTTDGRTLVMPRHAQPDTDHLLLFKSWECVYADNLFPGFTAISYKFLNHYPPEM
jgi:hypothetical protein